MLPTSRTLTRSSSSHICLSCRRARPQRRLTHSITPNSEQQQEEVVHDLAQDAGIAAQPVDWTVDPQHRKIVLQALRTLTGQPRIQEGEIRVEGRWETQDILPTETTQEDDHEFERMTEGVWTRHEPVRITQGERPFFASMRTESGRPMPMFVRPTQLQYEDVAVESTDSVLPEDYVAPRVMKYWQHKGIDYWQKLGEEECHSRLVQPRSGKQQAEQLRNEESTLHTSEAAAGEHTVSAASTGHASVLHEQEVSRVVSGYGAAAQEPSSRVFSQPSPGARYERRARFGRDMAEMAQLGSSQREFEAATVEDSRVHTKEAAVTRVRHLQSDASEHAETTAAPPPKVAETLDEVLLTPRVALTDTQRHNARLRASKKLASLKRAGVVAPDAGFEVLDKVILKPLRLTEAQKPGLRSVTRRVAVESSPMMAVVEPAADMYGVRKFLGHSAVSRRNVEVKPSSYGGESELMRKHDALPIDKAKAKESERVLEGLLDAYAEKHDQRMTANSSFLDSLPNTVAPHVRKHSGGSASEDYDPDVGKYGARTVSEGYIGHGDAWGRRTSWRGAVRSGGHSRAGFLPSGSTPSQARALHTSPRRYQQGTATADVHASQRPPDISSLAEAKTFFSEKPNGIRAQLREWQELHGRNMVLDDNIGLDADEDTGDVTNNLTRLPSEVSSFGNTAAQQEEEEREAMAHFMQAPSDEPSAGSEANTRFLKMGELVELEYLGSDRENVVAVFIRSTGANMAQFYTMQGRWVHMQEKRVQYSIPGWVDAEMIKPMLDYLPSPEEVEEDLDKLMSEAYMKDLSVPRHVSAPLITRMVEFHAQAQEVYRRHAGTFDNAHNLLAHETDLRYGSLVSAATTLLKLPADKLPVPALYAVRQALAHAGFAFNIDRRSHRLTGYLQIRSKEQVKMVDQVRRWLREWQDDLASTATKTAEQLRRHKPAKGASYVYSFIEKAKVIVLRSREDRQPTETNIGPSKVRLPLTPESDCIRITKTEEFTEQDTELVRFMEAWSLSQMFVGLPRVESLPPLILQATGLYAEMELRSATGLVFLQELGTVMPYENRVRFDQHLLLPSSQHSKPLQNLMKSLMDMAEKHDFVDSMADLRHDWGKLPVYCIDGAGAHEIDDGISVEPVMAADGVSEVEGESWVHVHIANPTAFFNRDHPLAKMARHMGESIYMPERTYMMLPRWATQRHFSLAKDRPCLTFSARLDGEGRTLETVVRPGRVKNVLRLTHEEVSAAMGLEIGDAGLKEITLTVGGEPPLPKARKSQVGDVTPKMVADLRRLQGLGDKRAELRREQGGLFFDTMKPEVEVWQSYKAPGLAWDHPHRRGSRRVEGDPVIRMKSKGLVNWFSPRNDPVGTLVREMMLLACGVAASWCRERGIPAVFRGSLSRPDRMDSGKYFREYLAPAAEASPDGEYPMLQGMRYLETFGNTGLKTSPFRHRVLGMDEYGKVTSPLRRYGDMILHWQIEAAIREEARTGRSLKVLSTDEEGSPSALQKLDRKFLPFSTSVLQTILVGLQPREHIITRAKFYAENFWINMLLFRAVQFSEIPPEQLPFGADGRTVHAYIHSPPQNRKVGSTGCIVRELNITATVGKVPEELGGLRQGDVWECEIERVDCFQRVMLLRPRRLVERVE